MTTLKAVPHVAAVLELRDAGAAQAQLGQHPEDPSKGGFQKRLQEGKLLCHKGKWQAGQGTFPAP